MIHYFLWLYVHCDIKPRELQTSQIIASVLFFFLQFVQYLSLSRCLTTILWLTDYLIWRESVREKIVKNKSEEKNDYFFVPVAIHRALCLLSHLVWQSSEGDSIIVILISWMKKWRHERMSTLSQLTAPGEPGFEPLQPDSKACTSPLH